MSPPGSPSSTRAYKGDPLAEDDIEQFFDSALALLRIDGTEECVNRFFDRLSEAIKAADELSLPNLPSVLTLAGVDGASAPPEPTVG